MNEPAPDRELRLIAVLPNSVPPEREAWVARAQRAGMTAVEESSDDAVPLVATAYDAYRAIADGATALRFSGLLDAEGEPTAFFYEARTVALFLTTFQEIILRGKREGNVKSVRGGLIGHETRTAQAGSILWIENASATDTITGSAFPYLPEVTVGPRTIFPYVHDAPVGGGASYLGAYAGLVKSDALVLTAHILPDPHDGIRVYVYGEPGETREVAVWSGNDRGRGVEVRFRANTPQFYRAGMSQIVALPASLAGRTWLPANVGGSAPVLIGPDDVLAHDELEAAVLLAPARTHTLYALRPDGAITEISVETPAPACALDPAFDDSRWHEIDDLATEGNGADAGWYRSRIHLPDGDGGDFHLHFGDDAEGLANRLTVWVNGERLSSPSEVARLRDGDNLICVWADWRTGDASGFGPVDLIPLGGCYLIDIRQWRYAANGGSVSVTVAL